MKKTSIVCVLAICVSSLAIQSQSNQFVKNYVADLGDRKVEVEGVCSISEDQLDCWKPTGEKNPVLTADMEKYLTEKKDDYANKFRFAYNSKNRLLVLKTTYLSKSDGSRPINMAGVAQDQYAEYNAKNIWRPLNYLSTPGGDPQAERSERRILQGSFDVNMASTPLAYFFSFQAEQKGTQPVAPGQFTIGGNVYEILSVTTKEQQQTVNTMAKVTEFQIKLVKVVDPDLVVYLMPANDAGKPYVGFDAKGKPLLAEEYMKYIQQQPQRNTKTSGGGFGSLMPNTIYGMSIDPRSSVRPNTDKFSLVVNLETSKFKKLAISVVKRTTFDFEGIHLDSK